VSAVNRTTDTIERALPVIVVAAIVALGYFLFVQPRVAEYLRARTEITSLEERVRTLQDTVNRGKAAPSANEAAALKLFEERMSTDDRVADVVELLAKIAADSAPKGTIKGLQIGTGASAQWPASAGQATTRSGGGEAADEPDPRFGLFPVTLTYTPVTVTFQGSYDAIQRFVWRLRDMPTMIEIRSMELARGLPLMQVVVRLFVYQRGAVAVSPGLIPPGPAGSPQAPRVARLSVAEGW
jgi:Tfp pilus assembly protein PilO